MGSIPVAGVDAQGGENAGLEGVPAGDDLDDVLAGLEVDPADALEFTQGAGG